LEIESVADWLPRQGLFDSNSDFHDRPFPFSVFISIISRIR
ncbi:32790_t:CDS:1, partial [Gigaspora margarita]